MTSASDKKEQILSRKISIYSNPETKIFYNEDELLFLICKSFIGTSFSGLALRTRSKKSKELLAECLGYETPKSFKKTQPRFPNQNLDIYLQKSNNLQIWNEEVSSDRRYVLVKLDENDIVLSVKIIKGDELIKLDTTGTLTQKYQASLIKSDIKFELINESDTDELKAFTTDVIPKNINERSPIDNPKNGEIISIKSLFNLLKPLLGKKFKNAGIDQERNRGAELHKLICEKIGYPIYSDNGQFPDIKHQLLEVKLQTSPTIDLGLVKPDSKNFIKNVNLTEYKVKHEDTRYILFFGEITNDIIELTHMYLVSGQYFFDRFKQFEGKVVNKKIQIPLPKNFFN